MSRRRFAINGNFIDLIKVTLYPVSVYEDYDQIRIKDLYIRSVYDNTLSIKLGDIYDSDYLLFSISNTNLVCSAITINSEVANSAVYGGYFEYHDKTSGEVSNLSFIRCVASDRNLSTDSNFKITGILDINTEIIITKYARSYEVKEPLIGYICNLFLN